VVAFVPAEAWTCGGLDGDCEGRADEEVAVLDPAAGLGLSRLREPMTQVERGKERAVV
jgi:hypothetical protein